MCKIISFKHLHNILKKEKNIIFHLEIKKTKTYKILNPSNLQKRSPIYKI